MPRFSYYRSLPRAAQRTYDKSDKITLVALPRLALHRERAETLRAALVSEARKDVESSAQALVTGITRSLGVRNVKVRVLAKRPKNREGELHGLYTLETDGRAHIEVWMRTAEHERVVAFRTFLRTLLHEVCHHLDFTLFGLSDTFHTEGFFRRESSLVKQLTARDAPEAAAVAPSPSPRKASRRRAQQLSLFEN